jgi:hypothetical protein
MSDDRHVAVADVNSSRVSVFSVDGEFIRHVGVGVLTLPRAVACSASDELVVGDNHRVVVFSAGGDSEEVMTMGHGGFSGVAVHGATVFAQDHWNAICVVFH